MPRLEPGTPEELAEQLKEANGRGETICVSGRGSKTRMGGPVVAADHQLSTARLARVLNYEPRDLTVSVEAGYRFSALQEMLAREGQMIALDPPCSQEATVGGIVASNASGPLRRGYGTARDLVIGMKFATLEGKMISAGGMVVKNVAGLDMGKVMIGSFGTLAVLTSVNFRLHSVLRGTETFLYSFPDFEEALAKRDAILASPVQPVAMDLLSPAMAMNFNRRGFLLALRTAGSAAVLERFRSAYRDAEPLRGRDDGEFWMRVAEAVPDFLDRHPEGAAVRVSTTLSGIYELPKTVGGAFVVRAGTGVAYFLFTHWAAAAPWWRRLEETNCPAVVEWAADHVRANENCWIQPATEAGRQGLAMMEKMKAMFDRKKLLNVRRMYGRI